jgi:hypothetical protein
MSPLVIAHIDGTSGLTVLRVICGMCTLHAVGTGGSSIEDHIGSNKSYGLSLAALACQVVYISIPGRLHSDEHSIQHEVAALRGRYLIAGGAGQITPLDTLLWV